MIQCIVPLGDSATSYFILLLMPSVPLHSRIQAIAYHLFLILTLSLAQ